MPYIETGKRAVLDPKIHELATTVGNIITTDHGNDWATKGQINPSKRDGMLNYIITRLISKLYKTSYTELNAAIGMLECAKLELYRRRLAPYENAKMAEHGDVYSE